VIRPNEGFLMQLIEYEEKLFGHSSLTLSELRNITSVYSNEWRLQHGKGCVEERMLTDPIVPVPIAVDTSIPTTRIEILLYNGASLKGVFNVTQTISDVRRFIDESVPEEKELDYALCLPFPQTLLTDLQQTIYDARLLNATLVQVLPSASPPPRDG